MNGALLERERELGALSDLLAAAERGHGGLVQVEGPPGVGKSALIEHVAALARERGLPVLRARGHELERAYGWGVARSLLEAAAQRDDLLAGPAAPARTILDPGAESAAAPVSDPGFAILHALYWLVVRLAEAGPLLVAIDDAQWADEPSLRFLIYLAGRVSEHPIALIVAARAGEAGEGELLTQLAGAPRVLTLPSLGAAGVAELVRERLPEADDELCRRCFGLTAGNPLQLRVLLAAIEQQPRPADAAALAAAAEDAASLARALGRAPARRPVARRASAGPRRGGVRGRRAAAPRGGARRSLRRRGARRRGRAGPGGPAAGRRPAGLHPPARAVRGLRAARVRRARPHPLPRGAPAGRGRRVRRARERAPARVLGGLRRHRGGSPAHDGGPRTGAGRADVRGALPRAGTARAAVGGAFAPPCWRSSGARRRPPACRTRWPTSRPRSTSRTSRGSAPRCCSSTAACSTGEDGRATPARRSGAAATSSARDGGDLAVELAVGYLSSAMQTPDRAAEAHRRADEIVAFDSPPGRAERALTCRAMIMRLWVGAPRRGDPRARAAARGRRAETRPGRGPGCT